MHKSSVLVHSSLILSLAACAAPQGSRETTPERITIGELTPPAQETALTPRHEPSVLDLMSLMPTDATGLIQADLRRLRSTAHYATLADTLVAFTGLDARQTRAVLDQTDELVAALGEEPEGTRLVAVALRGTPLGPEPVSFLRSDRVRQRLGDAISIDSDTWLLDGGATAANPPESDRRFREPLVEMLDNLLESGPMLTIALAPRPENRARLSQMLRVVPREHADSLHAIGLSASFAPGLELRVLATTSDATVASTIGDLARREIDRLRSHFMVNALGLGPLVHAAQVHTDREIARLSISLNTQDTDQLLNRRAELLELARALGDP